ncbi:ribonuclease E [Thorsellia kenyensis]|uniref:Ribonuclease E n=1 Tax=Thorsellia kenyensis TaxID=1549888 RepID=A0ABV6C6W5_9GAMM
MKRMLINATQQEELRVALVDGQRLYDLDIENTSHELKKSNIYKGKISKLEPSLDAAWVDYGCERRGFLPFKEVSREYFSKKFQGEGRPNITDVLEIGQELIVQVEKEERGNKNAVLTTFISLAGSYLVLMPNNPRAGGISRRIEGEERTELKTALSSLDIPNEMGLIIRTAGMGKSPEALQWDLSFRVKHWEAIKEAAASRPAPFLIHQESSVIVRAFRDYLRPEVAEILIDSPELFEEAKLHIATLGRPDFISKIKLYTGDTPLFSHFQIESQIESAYQREVRLPSGGSIVIDTTEALTAIDINSARSTRGRDIEETAYHTNLEAADEIARQLRLRDLGGLIVIDFIDMTPIKHQRDVEMRLKDAVKSDRARIQFARISKFGLLEMSRQRLSPSLNESSHHICPRCSGTGRVRDNESLSLSILRLIEEAALKDRTSEVQVIVPVQIASYLLNEKRSAVQAIEKEHEGLKIIIVPNENMQTPHYHIQRMKRGDGAEQLSYQLAESYDSSKFSYAEESVPVKKVPVAQQPAVKAHTIKADTPPPVTAAKVKEGLFTRLSKFLTGLFKSEEAKPETKEAARQSTQRPQRNNRPRRERNRNPRVTKPQEVNSEALAQEQSPAVRKERIKDNSKETASKENNRSELEGVNKSDKNSYNSNKQTASDNLPNKPRRERRKLTDSVRVKATKEVIENQLTLESEVIQELNETSFSNENNEKNKRSRRNMRQMRSNGQKRRKYRQLTATPMVMEGAFASPEMSTGKVWVNYDLLSTFSPSDETDQGNRPNNYDGVDLKFSHEDRTLAAKKAEDRNIDMDVEKNMPANAVQNTDNLEVSLNSSSKDVAILGKSTLSEPQTEDKNSNIVLVHSVNESVSSETKDYTNISANVDNVQTVIKNVEKNDMTDAISKEGNRLSFNRKLHSRSINKASSPVTKAPAPPYVPSVIPYSDWERPAFVFVGKGKAGGHIASKQSSAPMTRPEYH